MTDNASKPAFSRRNLLKGAAGLGAATAAGLLLPPNVRRALASTDAPKVGSGSINDIEHVVFLMQENRSFDHYFGTFPGVRGFSDPNALTLPNGNSVFQQPDPSHADGYLLPFHYDTKTTNAQHTPETDNTWPTQHQAWDNGAMDAWIPAKGQNTMGYFEQADIPFHWALAEAFTICDGYHCSVMGQTVYNRLYMWTGWLDPAQFTNGMSFNDPGLTWTTYPERLTAAGISWQVYQEYDNFDDNALAWFTQYAYADHSSPLWQQGMSRRPAGWFEDDAINDRLPQVSWIISPASQSEHPNWTPAAGAQYIASKIDAIAANPEVWAKTAFFLMYDENDGLFDHVLPPTPPAGTANEFVDGLPIGLGFRVPCIVVSPWTVGGYVATETFDHSSLIRFLEQRFGVMEPNITDWRRQTVGDLTSAFQFSQSAPFPAANQAISLRAATSGLDDMWVQTENGDPTVPAVNTPPVQETTSRTGYLRNAAPAPQTT